MRPHPPIINVPGILERNGDGERIAAAGGGGRQSDAAYSPFSLSEEEVKIVCVRVSLGGERGLGTHTYADTLGETVTPCLFLDHILYCCSRQLCQRSSKRYIVLYTLPG